MHATSGLAGGFGSRCGTSRRNLVASGTPAEVANHPDSLTARYLKRTIVSETKAEHAHENRSSNSTRYNRWPRFDVERSTAAQLERGHVAIAFGLFHLRDGREWLREKFVDFSNLGARGSSGFAKGANRLRPILMPSKVGKPFKPLSRSINPRWGGRLNRRPPRFRECGMRSGNSLPRRERVASEDSKPADLVSIHGPVGVRNAKAGVQTA